MRPRAICPSSCTATSATRIAPRSTCSVSRPERVRTYPASTRLDFDAPATFATATLRHHAPCATAIRALRDRLPWRALAGGPRRVYLSRAGMPHSRRIRNEAAIESMLERRGFAIVRPETLTLIEQARAVANAECIVGPYGANLANLVFAAPDARVVVIATKAQPEFARLAAIIGLRCRHVVPAAVQVRAGRTYSESVEFDVDAADLERALDA